MGVIAFSPLAQGLLSDRYLEAVPAGSRATQGKSLDPGSLDQAMRKRLSALSGIATSRGQSLAQMAIAWVLRGSTVTSALIGASRPEQIVDCVSALQRREFDNAELRSIEQALVM